MSEIVSVPMRKQAYIILKDAIITGKLVSGERIVEDDLAEKFQISRTPLREALHRLEQDGLLYRPTGRGLAVTYLSEDEAKQLYEVRSKLEGLATRLAVVNLTADDKSYLKNLSNKFEKSGEELTNSEMKEFSRQLHGFIFRKCKNVICNKLLEKIEPLVARYKYVSVAKKGRNHYAYLEHLEILDCMIDGDVEKAERAMVKHIKASFEGSIISIHELNS